MILSTRTLTAGVLAASLGVVIAISSLRPQEQDSPEVKSASEPAGAGAETPSEDTLATRADSGDHSIEASEKDAEGETFGRSDNVVDTEPTAVQDADPGIPARERPVTELRAMSQTFRNSTFLIAIREAGFSCDDVVSANESADGVWLASCADKLGYTLSVRGIDQFDVRPVAHYFDGVGPVPIERDRPLERR